MRNHPSNGSGNVVVQIKWFCNDMLNPEGFNLYRRQVGFDEWVRLNESPISKKAGINSNFLSIDEELEFFVSIVNDSPQDLNEEFVFLNLLLKSFESNQLAEFLGIYFEDESAISGQSYQYRVTRIKNGKEQRLNQSRMLQAGSFRKTPAVEEVEIYQDKGIVAINWKQDEQLFYAVNI
ncbi:MAG: hypothetical protein RJQ14_09265, partial [Marinoscillum sp.]